MNDIMKAIAILQCLRDTMRARHNPHRAYHLDLSKGIDQLAEAIAYMLHLRDIITSLRSLQAEDVTDEQVEAVQTQAPEGLPGICRTTIASVMRGMVASLDKPADSA